VLTCVPLMAATTAVDAQKSFSKETAERLKL
jgi:hypothetical protein